MMVLMFIADDRRFGAAHMALLDRLSLPTSVSRIEHQQPPPNVRFWLLQGPVKWPALFARARRAQYACARLPASVRVPQPAPQPFDPFRLVHRIYFSRSDRFPSAPFSATTSRASISRARAGYTGSNQPIRICEASVTSIQSLINTTRRRKARYPDHGRPSVMSSSRLYWLLGQSAEESMGTSGARIESERIKGRSEAALLTGWTRE